MNYLPYTYLIGWTKYNKWYYGAEFSKRRVAHPNNLWTTYFTSSKIVTDFRKTYGEPDVIEVRKTFENGSDAHSWESKVLTRLNAAADNRFLNRHNAGSKFFCDGHSDQTKQKLSAIHKGKVVTNEQKLKISNALKGAKSPKYGTKDTDETRCRKSQSLKGRKKTAEHIANFRKSRIGKTCGSNHHGADQHKYQFIHPLYGEYFGTCIDLKLKYPELKLNGQYLLKVARAQASHHKKWQLE